MATIGNIFKFLLTLILIHLSACHPDIKTINFAYLKIPDGQLSMYSSFRDLPLKKYRLHGLPFYLIIKMIAIKLNISKVATYAYWDARVIKNFNSEIEQKKVSNQVTVLPKIVTMLHGVHSPMKQWERFRISKEKPIYISTHNFELNFVYCDLPRWEKEPLWSLGMLTKVFDNLTWTCMATTATLILITLGRERWGRNLVVLLSSLLCNGICEGLKKRNLLFVVWLFLIRILADLYSGEVSSQLISPRLEQRLKLLSDVDASNYSAVVESYIVKPYAIETLSYLTSNKTGTWIYKAVLPAINLYKRSFVPVASSFTYDKFAEFVVRNYNSKIIYLSEWYYPVYGLNVIESSRENGLRPFENGALCHLGEETLKLGTYLWTFLPPNHKLVAYYFQQLVETGIFSRALKEQEGVVSSVRVQERTRVIGKTRLKPGKYAEKMTQELQQRLQKKLWKVFFLFGLCVLACLIGLGVELFLHLITFFVVVPLQVFL